LVAPQGVEPCYEVYKTSISNRMIQGLSFTAPQRLGWGYANDHI